MKWFTGIDAHTLNNGPLTESDFRDMRERKRIVDSNPKLIKKLDRQSTNYLNKRLREFFGPDAHQLK